MTVMTNRQPTTDDKQTKLQNYFHKRKTTTTYKINKMTHYPQEITTRSD